jgi:CO dehydrogenase/acetyl-CoA synthase epsilon subunit
MGKMDEKTKRINKEVKELVKKLADHERLIVARTSKHYPEYFIVSILVKTDYNVYSMVFNSPYLDTSNQDINELFLKLIHGFMEISTALPSCHIEEETMILSNNSNDVFITDLIEEEDYELILGNENENKTKKGTIIFISEKEISEALKKLTKAAIRTKDYGVIPEKENKVLCLSLDDYRQKKLQRACI